jgi:hypothetical protein
MTGNPTSSTCSACGRGRPRRVSGGDIGLGNELSDTLDRLAAHHTDPHMAYAWALGYLISEITSWPDVARPLLDHLLTQLEPAS